MSRPFMPAPYTVTNLSELQTNLYPFLQIFTPDTLYLPAAASKWLD